MKTYYFRNDSYWADNGCDCCEPDYFEAWNCDDIDHTCFDPEGCYLAVLDKETGVDWYEQTCHWTIEEYMDTLKQMNVEVIVEE